MGMQSALSKERGRLRTGVNLEASASDDEAFFALRARAYELADTARHKRWDQVAYALRAEGFLPSLIMRLNDDALAVMMITRCCTLARQA